MSTRRVLGALGAAALALSLMAPAAQAADYVAMDATELQQTVLRAQFPSSLGSWRQNMYFTMTNDAPTVCWNGRGEAVTLPKAPVMGGVGYEVSSSVTSGVYVYQYASASAAASALAALAKIDCPDDAKVGEDGPASAVPAQQASDYTSAALDSYVSSITSTQGGVKVTTETRTTQRGLAVVQTQVTVSGPASGRKWVSRASATNKRWHARVMAAYSAFGTGESR